MRKIFQQCVPAVLILDTDGFISSDTDQYAEQESNDCQTGLEYSPTMIIGISGTIFFMSGIQR